MDMEKCRILLQVIEDGSLTRTADKSGYTISGISRMDKISPRTFGSSPLVGSSSSSTLG